MKEERIIEVVKAGRFARKCKNGKRHEVVVIIKRRAKND